jgi:hypothetical protein
VKLRVSQKEESTMAKPNFQFQKRQKELERKKKNDEKLQRKLEKHSASTDESPEASPAEEESP